MVQRYLAVLLSTCLLTSQVSSSPPNIVLIVADDLGWNDVGYNGATDCYTPGIDDLRDKGVVMSYFYSHPKCAPSRAALLTGRHPYRYGFQHDSATTNFIECGLNLTETLLSNVLQDNGYKTYMLGKWHLGFYQWDYTPNYRGFDKFAGYYSNQEYYTTYNYSTNGVTGVDFRLDGTAFNPSETAEGDYAVDLYTNYTLNWLETLSAQSDPFFLYIAHQAPHTPVEFINSDSKVIKQNSNIPSSANYRKNYCSLVYALDRSIDDTVSKLRSLDLWDNTWVIFLSDNGNAETIGSGYPLRGIKGTFFEGGIRVPMIVSGGLLLNRRKGRTEEESGSLVDIFPTICRLTGIDCSDYDLDGIDLYDYLFTANNDTLNRNELLLNVNEKDCTATYTLDNVEHTVCGAIRYGDLKAVIGSELIGGGTNDYYWEVNDLVTNVSENDITVHCNGIRPDVNLTNLSWDCGYLNTVCLFNITADPCEYNDLSENTNYKDILDTMMSSMISTYNIQTTPLQETCGNDKNGADPDNHNGFWTPWGTSPTGANGTNWNQDDDDDDDDGDSDNGDDSGDSGGDITTTVDDSGSGGGGPVDGYQSTNSNTNTPDPSTGYNNNFNFNLHWNIYILIYIVILYIVY